MPEWRFTYDSRHAEELEEAAQVMALLQRLVGPGDQVTSQDDPTTGSRVITYSRNRRSWAQSAMDIGHLSAGLPRLEDSPQRTVWVDVPPQPLNPRAPLVQGAASDAVPIAASSLDLNMGFTYRHLHDEVIWDVERSGLSDVLEEMRRTVWPASEFQNQFVPISPDFEFPAPNRNGDVFVWDAHPRSLKSQAKQFLVPEKAPKSRFDLINENLD
jgi:hypothetical protein